MRAWLVSRRLDVHGVIVNARLLVLVHTSIGLFPFAPSHRPNKRIRCTVETAAAAAAAYYAMVAYSLAVTAIMAMSPRHIQILIYCLIVLKIKQTIWHG